MNGRAILVGNYTEVKETRPEMTRGVSCIQVGPSSAASSEDLLDCLAVHIRQPALDAVVVIGKSFVVDAKQVQDGSVKVVPVSGFIDGLPAYVVGSPVGQSVP